LRFGSTFPGIRRVVEAQLKRVGGGATLIVVAESPDRAANERFIDDVSANVKAARAVGMQAIHFSNADALRASLAGLGLPV